MATNHNLLTDPYVHEPKGITTASANEVYFANGSGSGSWKAGVTLSTVDLTTAEMKIENNSSTNTVSAASDSSLSTLTNYVKISGNWVTGEIIGDNISFLTDKLVINKNAPFLVTVSLSFSSLNSSSYPNVFAVATSLSDTNTGIILPICKSFVSASNLPQTISFSFLKTFSSGNSISIWMAAKEDVNIIIQNATVILKEVINA